MLGALILAAILLVFPAVVCMSLAVGAGLLGWALKDDAEGRYEGSELVDLYK
jgi:hypothetical protein